MRSISRITRTLSLVLVAVFVLAGCALHPRRAERAAPTAVASTSGTPKVVVARVNDAELSLDALITVMNELPDKTGDPSETQEQRRQRALESLVLLELAYQRANTLGIKTGPHEIEIAMTNFKDALGGEKEYAEYLTARNTTEEALRSEVERKLVISLIYKREVEDLLAIPDDELKSKYEQEKQQLVQHERVSVIDVYLVKNDDKSASKKARALLRKMQADPQQDPWKLVLDNTFVVRNLIVRQDREKELYDAARKLKPQELSGVIKTQNGYHIIKLKEYSPERQLTFAEARTKIEAALKGPYQERRTQEWEQLLKKEAKIVLLDRADQQKQ